MPSFQSALFKIKSVLKSVDKEYLSGLEDHIAVVKNNFLPSSDYQNMHLQTILESISQRRVLFLRYYANHNQSESERMVEAVGIFFSAGYWHLIGYCQLRQDYRDFRLDRILHLNLTKDQVGQKHPSLKTYLERIAKDEKELTLVIIRIDQSYIRHLGDQKYYMGYVSEKKIKTEVEMTFLCSSIEGFARWYMMFGDKCKIITPISLQERVKELALSICEL